MAANIRDVAARAGVSVGTVSNVLNHRERVAPDAVRRVHDAIAALGYVRNDAARQLRAGRSRSIGLVVLDLGNPFFADVARGAQSRAGENGIAVLVGNSDEDAAQEGIYLDLFREQRVNGVLITPVSDDIPRLESMRQAGVPVILVDREAPGTPFLSVSVDDVEGGHLAVSHLLAAGRRRIAVIAGPESIPQVADRLEGARRAVAEVSGATLEVLAQPALTVLHGRAAGESIVARPAGERPDAVFALNDVLAVGVLQAVTMRAGLRVPDDIALIGYDDIDFAAAAVVPLSSIRQPAELIGATAVDLLFQEIAAPRSVENRNVRFRPELVVRESTTG
jgi:LacI family transcriptional regulator